MAHRLAHLLDRAARDEFPVVDGRVEVAGATGDGYGALVCFTGHSVLAVDIDAAEVERRAPAYAYSVVMSPTFLQWIGACTGLVPVPQDAVFAALAVGADGDGEAGGAELGLERVDDLEHSRVERAMRYRRDTRIYATPDRSGVVVLGRGLTRRWELAFEVDDRARGTGLGRKLAGAARTLLPAGTPLWAQVAPGNAQSMRAVAAAGFRPVGSEVLFVRR